MWIQSLGGEDLLEEEMTNQSNILAWEIPWTEEPGGLQPMGSPRVGPDCAQHCTGMGSGERTLFLVE